jgi:hypothetical protein
MSNLINYKPLETPALRSALFEISAEFPTDLKEYITAYNLNTVRNTLELEVGLFDSTMLINEINLNQLEIKLLDITGEALVKIELFDLGYLGFTITGNYNSQNYSSINILWSYEYKKITLCSI